MVAPRRMACDLESFVDVASGSPCWVDGAGKSLVAGSSTTLLALVSAGVSSVGEVISLISVSGIALDVRDVIVIRANELVEDHEVDCRQLRG